MTFVTPKVTHCELNVKVSITGTVSIMEPDRGDRESPGYGISPPFGGMGIPGFTVGTKFTSCSSPFSHAKTPYVHIVLAVHDRVQHTTFTPGSSGSHTMVSLGLRLSEARTVTFPEFAALIEKAVAVAARRPFA